MVRPGVYVEEAPLPRVAPIAATSGTYGAFIGTALRGPVVPTLINSWTDFNAAFGGFVSGRTLPVALHQYFSNGGGPAYVCRVLPIDGTEPVDAGGAVAAKVTTGDTVATVLKDRLRFTAVTAGSWGNGIAVDITVNPAVMVVPPGGGTAVADATKATFSIIVYENIRGVGVAVERFRDLSMVTTASRYITSIINSQTIGSRYIVVEDIVGDDKPLVDSTTDPEPLKGGSEGTNPIDPTQYNGAFALFDEIDAMLVVNIPGVDSVTGISNRVQARGDSILLIDTEAGLLPTEGTIGSAYTSSYDAVYYPWLHIADPDPSAPRGSTMLVPPGASMAGIIMRTDKSRGVFKAPAGVNSYVVGAVANERRLTNTELDNLAAKNINVIRPVAGVGITAMGARTRSNDTAQYISVRRTLNYVKSRAVRVSRFALFEPNTPALWEQVRVINGSFLNELWQMGGLAGRTPGQAYYVKCDEDINTPQTIQNGELHIEIGVSPAFPAEFVIIRVGQFEADASIVVVEE